MYEATTRSISVSVTPTFLAEQSDPDAGHYVWAYEIVIENRGAETVTLLNRYWHITDETGRVQEVRGPGVVGEHPSLEPGQSYSYTSGCPLAAPSGVMHGSYEMVNADGERFDVMVPAFSLDLPDGTPAVVN